MDGAVGRKYKELMAPAIAVGMTCQFFMQWPIEKAVEEEATVPELIKDIYGEDVLVDIISPCPRLPVCPLRRR